MGVHFGPGGWDLDGCPFLTRVVGFGWGSISDRGVGFGWGFISDRGWVWMEVHFGQGVGFGTGGVGFGWGFISDQGDRFWMGVHLRQGVGIG